MTYIPESELLSDKSNRGLAREYGVDEKTIRRKRKKIRESQDTAWTANGDERGNVTGEFTHNSVMGYDDFREFIRKSGQDPDKVKFSWGATSHVDGSFWNKLNNVTPLPESASDIDIDDLLELVGTYQPGFPEITDNDSTAVLCLADLQLGKVDEGGDTDTTIRLVVEAVTAFTEYLQVNGITKVVVVDGGDVIEGFCNVESQAQTNDLSLTQQIRLARRIMLRTVLEIAPHVDWLGFVSTPSNHTRVRTGIGSSKSANVPADDFGIDISYQVEDAIRLDSNLDHVEFFRPISRHELSLNVELPDGTNLGVVHGDVFGSQANAGKWWAGQDHGRGPVSKSDILVHGHFHNLRVSQSGNERWIISMPTADNGSSWYSTKTGERSRRGVLAFDVYRGQWSNIRIL